MTAEEIRKHWNVCELFPPELLLDFALVEIAAQLAEQNDILREIAKRASLSEKDKNFANELRRLAR